MADSDRLCSPCSYLDPCHTGSATCGYYHAPDRNWQRLAVASDGFSRERCTQCLVNGRPKVVDPGLAELARILSASRKYSGGLPSDGCSGGACKTCRPRTPPRKDGD